MGATIWLKKYVLESLRKIRRVFIGKYAEAILYKNKSNLYFLMGADDTAVGRKLAFDGNYEDEMIRELESLVNPDSTIIILGVHVGTLLIPLSLKVKKVFGFEANPETYKFLKCNLFLNEIKNVEIINIAIGDHAGKMEFYANKLNSGGSKIKPAKDRFYLKYDKPDVVEVNMDILDNYSFNTPQIDLMVIDIEGGEYNAFKGMHKTLALVKHLQVEYVPKHLKLISCVNNTEFFAPILPLFSSFKIIGEKKEYASHELFYVLDKYWQTNKGCDILFSK
jgi:FkbM family methyltransferase